MTELRSATVEEPLGVQVAGRRWGDTRVLAVAEAIDRLEPPLTLA